MDPCGTPALTGHYCQDFPSKTTWSPLLLRNKADYLTQNSVRLELVKKTTMPNSIERIRYIKCSISPWPIKSPSGSIKYNCQKICSWTRRPKNILEIRKRSYFSKWPTILLFTGFSKTLLTTEKRLTGR